MDVHLMPAARISNHVHLLRLPHVTSRHQMNTSTKRYVWPLRVSILSKVLLLVFLFFILLLGNYDERCESRGEIVSAPGNFQSKTRDVILRYGGRLDENTACETHDGSQGNRENSLTYTNPRRKEEDSFVTKTYRWFIGNTPIISFAAGAAASTHQPNTPSIQESERVNNARDGKSNQRTSTASPSGSQEYIQCIKRFLEAVSSSSSPSAAKYHSLPTLHNTIPLLAIPLMYDVKHLKRQLCEIDVPVRYLMLIRNSEDPELIELLTMIETTFGVEPEKDGSELELVAQTTKENMPECKGITTKARVKGKRATGDQTGDRKVSPVWSELGKRIIVRHRPQNVGFAGAVNLAIKFGFTKSYSEIPWYFFTNADVSFSTVPFKEQFMSPLHWQAQLPTRYENPSPTQFTTQSNVNQTRGLPPTTVLTRFALTAHAVTARDEKRIAKLVAEVMTEPNEHTPKWRRLRTLRPREPAAGVANGKIFNPDAPAEVVSSYLLPDRVRYGTLLEQHESFTRHYCFIYPNFRSMSAFGMSRLCALTAGLLDDNYFPAYFEDVDIRWRAWGLGFKEVFASQDGLTHFEGATIGAENMEEFLEKKKANNNNPEFEESTTTAPTLSHKAGQGDSPKEVSTAQPSKTNYNFIRMLYRRGGYVRYKWGFESSEQFDVRYPLSGVMRPFDFLYPINQGVPVDPIAAPHTNTLVNYPLDTYVVDSNYICCVRTGKGLKLRKHGYKRCRYDGALFQAFGVLPDSVPLPNYYFPSEETVPNPPFKWKPLATITIVVLIFLYLLWIRDPNDGRRRALGKSGLSAQNLPDDKRTKPAAFWNRCIRSIPGIHRLFPFLIRRPDANGTGTATPQESVHPQATDTSIPPHRKGGLRRRGAETGQTESSSEDDPPWETSMFEGSLFDCFLSLLFRVTRRVQSLLTWCKRFRAQRRRVHFS